MKKINKSSKIFLAGHTGLLGHSLLQALNREGYHNIITRTSKELDLTNQSDVIKFFKKKFFDFVILTAAKAGGIKANINKCLNLENKKCFITHNFGLQCIFVTKI